MEDLKVIIRQEKLYDPRNISVIWKPPWALLMRLLRAECEEKERNKIVFKYEEITELLSKYIKKRRNSLFDN